MEVSKSHNIAYVDGQNLHFASKEQGWKIDYTKFRTYLRDKYHVQEAYYFMGFVSEINQDLYDNLQKAGFILSFREHSVALKGKKKGNVDSDIIFHAMRKLVENEPFEKLILVSGDGDYKKLVDYLIKKERFAKILFPNREFASSLYKSLGGEFFDYLDTNGVKEKIQYKNGSRK